MLLFVVGVVAADVDGDDDDSVVHHAEMVCCGIQPKIEEKIYIN